MRNPTLDLLRAVAILLVFGRHAGLPFASRFGWVGVDLFFVLSGFLVSGLLFREYQQAQHIRPSRFLLRRGFKIYPQFYLLILVSAAGFYLAGEPASRLSVIAEIAFFQNYTHGLWDHTWSLAVEEHFYLVLAIGLAWMARRGGENPFRSLPKWIAAISLAILSIRIATWWWHPDNSFYRHITPSHLRMDSLLAGVTLSYFQCFHNAALAEFARRFAQWIPPASILLLSPVTFLYDTDPFIYTAGFSMIAVGFTLLLLSALYPARPIVMGAVSRAMVRLGAVSYAFYLWHIPMLRLAVPFDLAPPVMIAITFPASVAAAFLTTWAVEHPFLKLRDRWIPSLQGTPRGHSSPRSLSLPTVVAGD